MKNIKNVDGFLFAIIDEETAKKVFNSKNIVYQLYDDDTEAQVLFEEEFNDHNDNVFGIELGFLKDLEEEFEEGEQNRFRNNDKRDFNQWLSDKINVMLE